MKPKTILKGALGETSRSEQAALKLFVVLTRAHQSVAAHAEADIRKSGLTPAEFGVLEMLYHKGPTLLGEVQQSVLVSSGGMTFLVDKLVAKKLVERRDCPTDRRARYAALTPEGERLITRLFPRHAERIATVVGGLTQAEQRELTGLLRKLGLGAAAILTQED
ncbi:MAG: MarR family winged helix-turn-helix transcriptional regulator [Gemmatimonadota bacterium]